MFVNETQIYSKQSTGDFPNNNAVSITRTLYYMLLYWQVVQMIEKISKGEQPKMVTKTARGNSGCALL